MSLKNLLSKYENNNRQEEKKMPFFILKGNGDSTLVRFLIDNTTDLENFVFETHKIKIGEYDNKVKCIGKDCVCCRESRPSLRVYLPVLNLKTNQVELWERGIAEIKAIINLIEKYGKKHGSLSNCVFEIKRNGAKGDNKTTYSILFEEVDKIDSIDTYISEIPPLTGRNFRYILDLTAQQQADALVTGTIDWGTKKEESNEAAF